MAWNRSTNTADRPQKKKPTAMRGIVAGVLVVLAAIAYFVFFSDGAKTGEDGAQKHRGMIKEVTPAPAPKAQPVAPKPEKPAVVTNYNEKGVWYDDRGHPHYKPARIVHMGSNTVINGKHWVPPRKLFKHMSEMELDRVLSARPGDRIIGETNWRFFEKDLKDAMVNPIHIDPEDTPEEIERKEAVKAAKKELAAAIGNGEDPSKILRQAQDDLNKLATLYDNLNRELYEARSSGEMTEEEIGDYVKAANKMLESNNIFTKKFYTPPEIREKAAAAKERRLLKQQQQQQQK